MARNELSPGEQTLGETGVITRSRIRVQLNEGASGTHGEPFPEVVQEGHTEVDDPFEDGYKAAERIFREEDSVDGVGLAGGEYEVEAEAFSGYGNFARAFTADVHDLIDRGAHPTEIYRQLYKRILAAYREYGNQDEVDHAEESAHSITRHLLSDAGIELDPAA